MGTMTTIINEKADQMSHQMQGIGREGVDTLKFLPAGIKWKRIQADANEVLLHTFVPLHRKQPGDLPLAINFLAYFHLRLDWQEFSRSMSLLFPLAWS